MQSALAMTRSLTSIIIINRNDYPVQFIRSSMMDNITTPLSDEDIEKQIKSFNWLGDTIEIPDEALARGGMLPFLRSIPHIDRQPLIKLKSKSLLFDESDFKTEHVKAPVAKKKFYGFETSPVAILKEVKTQKMQISDYIAEGKAAVEKEGVATVKEFFQTSYKSREFLYIHNFKKSIKIFDISRKGLHWDISEECGISPGIDGISHPWFYIGSRMSMFPWHLEDYNKRSINFNFCGAPKYWFAVHQDDIPRVEAILNEFEPGQECKAFYRHKYHFVHPMLFTKLSQMIPVYAVEQLPGEAVLTNSFHEGFNAGVNYTYAFNFTLSEEDNKMFSIGSQCGPDCQYFAKSGQGNHPDMKLGSGLKCTFCGKSYTSNEGLKSHLLNIHQHVPEGKIGICPLCQKETQEPKKHMKRMHPNQIPVETCGYCRQQFKSKTDLNRHCSLNHKAKEEADRTCNNCKKYFRLLKDGHNHTCL